jgi:uncharacterized protein
MKIFFDSSAFAKRYIEQPGSEAVEGLCAKAGMLALSILCVPEIISALNRRLCEGKLSPNQYSVAKARLSLEVADAIIVNILPGVVSEAVRIMETHPLRSMDALHVACALLWKAELFVTSDDRQLHAAGAEKLRTVSV